MRPALFLVLLDPAIMSYDASSLSNPHKILVKHLDWKFEVDFDKHRLVGSATWKFQRVDPHATTLFLDSQDVLIHKVTTVGGEILRFAQRQASQPHLGTPLSIDLSGYTKEDAVVVHYESTPASSAAQWLPPEQTAGKQYPYLFTQGQAIHARSILPCQDAPGVKFTYTAHVTVPSWATCVMSAVSIGNKQEGVFEFAQKVPVSSYLVALAVGQLERRELSERCAIWSEPALLSAAAYEFAETEDFLRRAERLAAFDYPWGGRYDLLCLPPSFPYGGMENPNITFVTPTLLAGDRSLADVVAHEIGHSWTGNLVTNQTWDHFWLNEGWTTWFQRKITAQGNKALLDLDALGGYKSLQDTVQREMPSDFQKLVLNIGDQDPDDAYSTIAYEKGFLLLYCLEQRVGTEAFEAFFQAYVKHFAYKTLTSEDFREFFMDYFQKDAARLKDFDWDAWLYAPGMPPELPTFDRSLAQASEHLADLWLAVDRQGRMLPTMDISEWTTNQVICFLDAVAVRTASQPLKLASINAMNRQYEFASSKNAEILFRFCMLAVASEDEGILLVALHLCMSQGRMKYIRPLYRALFESKMGHRLAVHCFLENKNSYHPIAAKMVASDLVAIQRKRRRASWLKTTALVGVAALVAGVGTTLLRRKR